jgi:hypothetical protein
MNAWGALATVVLAVHLSWIVWVIFGWLVARNRPVLRWFHFGSLILRHFHRDCTLALSVDVARTVARIQGRRRRVSGAIPGPLPGSSGIPGCARASAGFRGSGRVPGQSVPPRKAVSTAVRRCRLTVEATPDLWRLAPGLSITRVPKGRRAGPTPSRLWFLIENPPFPSTAAKIGFEEFDLSTVGPREAADVLYIRKHQPALRSVRGV